MLHVLASAPHSTLDPIDREPASGPLRRRRSDADSPRSRAAVEPTEVVIGNAPFHRVRDGLVGGLIVAAALAAVVAAVSGHGELAAYLAGVGLVTSIGWVASFVESWTISADAVSRRRPLFTTTIPVERIRAIHLQDHDGVDELVISGRGWWSVEFPLASGRLGAEGVAALRSVVATASGQGAEVGAGVDDALARAS